MKPMLYGVLLGLMLTSLASAQNRLPQEYVSPDEIITLSADMTFDEAFEILSQIAYKKEGKTIIDPAKRQGRIDVEIVNLPWKKAFEVILKAHRLTYEEHEKFYEVVGEAEKTGDEVQISLSSREVHIEAIFFEGDRRALAEAGIDWSFSRAGNLITGTFGIKGGSAVSDEIVQGDGSYSENIEGVDYDFTGMFRAFESRNLGRILAQPEIVVVSGKQGRIQVGQDFSIKTRDFAGNIIDNFFSTGTILTVVPVVLVEENVNFIHLSIQAERSSATPDVVSTTINKSEAQTEVILIDGESTAIGGLYSRELKTVRKGFPLLKDLPWWALGLRYVFGYSLREVTDKELLVVLRAKLVPDLKTRSVQKYKTSSDILEGERKDKQKGIDKHWEQGVDAVDKQK
jgi:type IV pilus assembly protein PilQ